MIEILNWIISVLTLLFMLQKAAKELRNQLKRKKPRETAKVLMVLRYQNQPGEVMLSQAESLIKEELASVRPTSRKRILRGLRQRSERGRAAYLRRLLSKPPLLPHVFYGTVWINGRPAPEGTQVEARGDGVLDGTELWNPIEIAEPGWYGGPGGLDPKLLVQGNIEEGTTLTFYVKGVEAETDPAIVEWHSGQITLVDLTANTQAFCKNCGEELPPDSKEPCPHCGETGKDITSKLSTAIGLNPTIIHEHEGLRKDEEKELT